jgi:Holliday junction resolvasome RuvABC endonuclease subunit
MTVLLALDLGTTTGYCIGKPGTVTSGTANFKPSRYDGGGMRFVKFRAWLNQMLEAYPTLDRVAYEEVRRHAGTDAAHVYGGLMATLTSWCEEHKIPYEGVPVAEIKKFATGHGNASKDDMRAAACAWGFTTLSHDEADAIAIWHCRIAD